MNCKNCGAKYDKKSLNCPYCGSENKIVAEKQKKEILDRYDREAKEMEVTVPRQAVNRWTKYVLLGLGIVIVLFIVITVITVIISGISAKFTYNKDQHQLERLEEYFQKQDWQGMNEYMDDKEIRTQIYSKYTEVNDAWNYYDDYQNVVGIAGTEELALYYMYNVLEGTKKAMEDKALLGNENVMEDFYNDAVNELKEKGFSEEEINEISLGKKSERWEELIVKFKDSLREE